MCIRLVQRSRVYEISIDLDDAYLEERHVFLNPEILDNGLLTILKKYRILKSIDGVLYYNGNSIPIAMLNTGILRTYDKTGTTDSLNNLLVGGDK